MPDPILTILTKIANMRSKSVNSENYSEMGSACDQSWAIAPAAALKSVD